MCARVWVHWHRGGMDANPSDRVVELLRKLEGDAVQWGQARDESAARCERWSSALSGDVAAVSKNPTLAQRCTELLLEASVQDRRAAAASRCAKAAETSSLRAQSTRAEVEHSHTQAMQAVEARTQTTRRKLEELRAVRSQLMEAHRSRLAEQEQHHTEEVAAIERKISEIRRAADERAKEGRQQTADQKRRQEAQVASLQATFRMQVEELEVGMERYMSECERAIDRAERRVKEAGKATDDASRLCSEHVANVHMEASEQLRLHDHHRQAKKTDIDLMLGEHEEALALRLVGSAEREVATLTNRSEEDRMRNEVRAIEARIQQRRQECDELCRSRWLEAKALFDEVSEAGNRTAARIAECQDRADVAVHSSLAKLVENGSHEDHILHVQAQLNAALAAMREEFASRLTEFRQVADRQQRDAGVALVDADRRVEELRSEAKAQTEGRLRDAESAIRALHEEMVQAHGSAAQNLECARSEMVKFLETREEDLRCALTEVGPAWLAPGGSY